MEQPPAPRLAPLIEIRLRALMERLAVGDDAPPAQRQRLEGLCEAAAYIGEFDEQSLDAFLERLHDDIFGESLTARLGEAWRDYHPFPQLPLFGQRAPVSPSTPH